MDLPAIIIELGLFAATVIAAIVAWRGVKDARDARDDAQGAAVEANKIALQVASATTRTAEAQERIAAAAERPSIEPWLVEQMSAHRWKVTNNTGQNVDFVSLGSRPDGVIHTEHRAEVPQNVGRGESLYFGFGGGMADPPSMNLKVVWRDVAGDGQEWFRSIP